MNPQDILKTFELTVDLSEKGLGYVSPNPCVGCVILDADFQKIAEAYHQKYGEAHAEANALMQVKDSQKLQGAFVFVSLEPCAHEGRTPSCAKALAKLPVAAVIALVKDPNPLVSGQGFEILREKGIATYFAEDILAGNIEEGTPDLKAFEKALIEIGKDLKLRSKLQDLVNKSKELNSSFFYAIQNERPYVTLKWAQTLNGVIGHPDKRLMISGKKALLNTHHLRATRDLTLVGYKTLLQDNPILNIRFSSIQKSNKIAIVDPKLSILDPKLSLNVFEVHSPQNVFIIADQSLKEDPRAQSFSGNIIFVDRTEGKLNIEAALKILKKEYGIQSILVEGGATILKEFYQKGLWNEIYIYVSFKILKGIKSKIPLMRTLFLFSRELYLGLLGSDLVFVLKNKKSILK